MQATQPIQPYLQPPWHEYINREQLQKLALNLLKKHSMTKLSTS